MSIELCECGRPKGHAAPIYKAPSYIVEYPDGTVVQVSVAVRWNSYAARDGMPEVGQGSVSSAKVIESTPIEPQQDEPKQRKAPTRRATKATPTPKGQGSLF